MRISLFKKLRERTLGMSAEFNQELSYNTLVAKAKEAINNNMLDQALDSLIAAYQIEQTIVVNHLLVTVLIAQNQYQEAQMYADECLDSYLNDQKNVQMYLNLILHNHYFLNAWEIVAELPKNWQDSFFSTIKKAENNYRNAQAQTIKTVARHFYHLSDGNLADQQKRLMAANKLPRDEYVVGAKFILQDPFLTQMSRVSVLDQLRRLHVTESVQFINLATELVTVVPAELRDIFSDKVYQKVISVLKGYEKKLGSDMIHGLSEQIQLLLMLAYPDLTLVIEDATSWVEGLIAETFSLPLPIESEKQIFWRQKLQNYLINILN